MTITVEDGTGVAGAETYITTEECTSYHEKRGNFVWGTITDNQMEQALRRANDYLVYKYRSSWKGKRVSALQGLDWPRSGAIVEELTFPSNAIPQEVKNACAELAYRASMGPLIHDSESNSGSLTGSVIQETVGPITQKYAPASAESLARASTYEQIELMLAPLLSGGGFSRVMTKLTRV